jgi:hypothetical protein
MLEKRHAFLAETLPFSPQSLHTNCVMYLTLGNETFFHILADAVISNHFYPSTLRHEILKLFSRTIIYTG